jgi:hypothetical protein
MEEAIFRNGNIEVTKTMAKFGNITYPIAGIGSVSVTAPDRIGGYVLSVAIAIGGWTIGGGWALAGVIAAVVVAVVTSCLTYKLMLHTASGDKQALESLIPKLVTEVKEAIERAVVLRG